MNSRKPPNVVQSIEARRARRAAEHEKRVKEADRLRNQGNEKFKRGDYSGAAGLYINAIEVHGPKPILMSNLATAFYKMEGFEEAEWVATIALEYDPHHIKARFRRGMARKQTQALKAAAKDFETIIRYDPNFEPAKEELGIVRDSLKAGHGRYTSGDDAEYPKYDETPWADCSDSDTPDCKHRGIKFNRDVPCHDYNHGVCKKERACEYSHAPDEKSVRDELGKNVCTHFILKDCMYTAQDCPYLHDRTNLPSSGWWNYPEQVAAARKLQPEFDDKDSISDEVQPILRAQPRARGYAQRHKRQDIMEDLPFRHRALMQRLRVAAKVEGALPKSAPNEKFVLLISIELHDLFNDIDQQFLSALKKKIKFVQVVTTLQALKFIDSPHLTAIYVTDPGIARPQNAAFLDKVVAFSKNGGVVLAGGLLSSHIIREDFGNFTKAFGLPWGYGSYHRTTFFLNPTNELVKRNPSLVSSYSMKTLHASNVLPEHGVYRITNESRLESLIFSPTPTRIEDKGEAPVAQARVGRGWFGFVGDVNAEEASTKTILAMLGLLDAPLEPLAIPDVVDQQADGKVGGSKKKRSKAGKKGETSSESIHKQDVVSTKPDAASVTKQPGSTNGRKTIVIVALAHSELFEQSHADQLAKLKEQADVKISHTSAQVIVHLSSPNLAGVYIADEGILLSTNQHAFDKVVEYAVKGAGNLVVGGLFPGTARPKDFPLLFSAFGLGWKYGAYFRNGIILNSGHVLGNTYNQRLPAEMSMKAVFLHSFDPEDVVYSRYPEVPGTWEVPVLRAKVGQLVEGPDGKNRRGRVSYIGDVNAEEGTTKILLAIFGFLAPNEKPPPEDRQKFIMVWSGMVPFVGDSKEVTAFMDEAKIMKVEVIHGLSNARVTDLLFSKDLKGVFITDAGICNPENAFILSRLAEYVSYGGTVVFGRFFANTITQAQSKSFFKNIWSLDWTVGDEISNGVARSEKNKLALSLGDKLPATSDGSGRYLIGITEDSAVYVPTNYRRLWDPQNKVLSSPIVFSEVGKLGGNVGFVGVATLGESTRKVLYAMLGLL